MRFQPHGFAVATTVRSELMFLFKIVPPFQFPLSEPLHKSTLEQSKLTQLGMETTNAPLASPRQLLDVSGVDPDVLNSISDEDLAIWATPEGTTFVDGKPYFTLQKGIDFIFSSSILVPGRSKGKQR